MSEPVLRFTIEVEGWDQLRIVAPIAQYVFKLEHCRDETGIVDDIDVTCALDDAAYAVMLLLGKMIGGLEQAPKNEVTLDSEAWEYIPDLMIEVIELMKKLGDARIGHQGRLHD